jgi:glutamine synthetase
MMTTQPKAQPMTEPIAQLIAQHHIHEVECVIPDMTGIARGKILPKDLFLSAGEMRLPKSVLLNTVNGQQPDNGPYVGDTDPDMICKPDPATFRIVPWAAEPVAVVIHDCLEPDGSPVSLSPRAVLRRVLDLYRQRGWQPVVAPEMEFFLVARQQNPPEPLHPPIGRTGKPEAGRQSYSIDAVNDFDPFFMELSSFCNIHRLGVETLIHEAGAGQMEINFAHGEALELADRVFLFKRTVRETALRHGIFATFMAKPMEAEPGSAMHIHQSILDTDGRNIFSAPDGNASPAFFHYIAGLQNYVPQVMPMFAPYVNSYRRLAPYMSAPTNVRWGYDNRTCGIRIPQSTPVNRRVENRVPGVDVNPYLAIAATLACGYQGMLEARQPDEALSSSAWNLAHELPRHLEDAIELLRACTSMRELLGPLFVDAFCAVKELEFGTYNRVISSWEREHLLLLV